MTWQILHLVDIVLWLLTAGSTLYVAFFAAASLIGRIQKKKTHVPEASPSPTPFLVIYPAYHEDAVIRQSVTTFLQQDYPHDRFQLTVVSDHMLSETNEWLSSMPVTLLQPAFAKSSKGKALQYAVSHAGAKDASWRVVILDADNVVAPDFLSRLDVLCRQGHRAIQCHRTAKNADNDIAVLDGLSEEINNTLFRRAHNRIGLSSALIGSGMCFEYEWFASHVDRLQTAVEDRELESLLMLDDIYIHYAEDIYVRDEKVSTGDNFQRQRLRWMTGQVQSLFSMLPHIPQAVMKGNVNYIDKTLQQALLPRSILLLVIPLMCAIVTAAAPGSSIKWWVLLFLLVSSLLIAIPAPLRSKALLKKLHALPKLIWKMAANLFRIERTNTDFIHTSHNK